MALCFNVATNTSRTGGQWYLNASNGTSANYLQLTTATLVNNNPTCPTGQYVLLNNAEMDALQVSSSRYVATADDYAAVTAIFAAVLTTSCIVWGVKRVYNLIANRPEA